jgi:hypothetical protein
VSAPCLDLPEDCQALIDRIAQSRCFERSPRQRELFLFLARQATEGRADGINEHQIGERVFGRTPDYNPADDNIVRVSARQLRIRLEKYFETEGKPEEWVIDIPKGSYRLAFRRREEIAAPDAAIRSEPESIRTAPRWEQGARSATVACLCIAFGFWVGTGLTAKQSVGSRSNGSGIELLLPSEPHPVTLVVADSALVIIQSLTGRIVDVGGYANHEALPRPEWRTSSTDLAIWNTVNNLPLTSAGDVGFVARLLQASDTLRQRVHVRHARSLAVSELREGDSIILGGPRVNPWASLFESNLNFQFRYTGSNDLGCIVNQKPRPGETSLYGPCSVNDRKGYVRVAWIPNLTRSGKVLLISGNSMTATEGACDFLLAAGGADRLRKLLGVANLKKLDSFELLFGVSEVAGASTGTELIACRLSQN